MRVSSTAPDRAAVTTRILRGAALAAATVVVSGCATLRATVGSYATTRDGVSVPQQRLRDALAGGDFAGALAWPEDDALLRTLNRATASYYASQFGRAAAVLDTAALLADDRITASLSRDALALVTNDMARPYQPRRTERLLIPYYGLLSYARLGAWEDAAVEARRLVLLLAQYADDRDRAERPLHAALGHLAAAVFERAGNRGEAEVAYRAARALMPALPQGGSVRGPTDGELLIVVEGGFVAHRTTETIDVALGDRDRDSLRLDEATRRRAIARAAARAVERWHDHPVDDDSYHLTIAFPTLRRSARAWPGQLRLAGDSAGAVVERRASVDDASAADERRERTEVAMRALARAAAKYALTKTVNETKGALAGQLANVGTSLLERADVRSWHLLPQEIAILRLPMAQGTHEVRLQVGEGMGAQVVSLGSVTVRAGEVTIAPVRLWHSELPMAARSSTLAAVADDSGCVALVCR
jgi:hypothetical protein